MMTEIVQGPLADSGPQPWLTAGSMLKADKFSQRKYFRVDTEISLCYWLSPELEPTVTLPALKKMRVNLSGGGIRFPVNEELRDRQWVGLAICLPAPVQAEIHCVGRVVRSRYTIQGRLEVAVEFCEVLPRDRELIIAFCFAEQRRLLRSKFRI